MKCPGCSAPAPDGSAECPSCGIIFAKFEEKRRKERAEAARSLEEPHAEPLNPMLGKLIGGALLAVWALGMSILYFHEVSRRASRPAPAPRAAAPVAVSTPTPAPPAPDQPEGPVRTGP